MIKKSRRDLLCPRDFLYGLRRLRPWAMSALRLAGQLVGARHAVASGASEFLTNLRVPRSTRLRIDRVHLLPFL